VPLAGQDRGRDVCDVVARDQRRAPVARRPGDRAVGPDHPRDEVEVHVHARERERHSRGADVLLGRPVVARERERRGGRGALE
jgi:hypothetical protein